MNFPFTEGKGRTKNKSKEQGLVKAIDAVNYFVVAFIIAQSKRRWKGRSANGQTEI